MKSLLSLLAIVFATLILLVMAPVIMIFKSYSLWMNNGEPLHVYFKTIAITLDQVGASIIYGVEDWTISSYTHLLAEYEDCYLARSFELFINMLAIVFEKDHCKTSYERERLELKKERGER